MPFALAVTSASGRVFRWGADEPAGGSRPSALQFTSVMPGGFQSLSCALGRRPDLEWPDITPFDDVRLSDRGGNRTVWEGRTAQFPGTMEDVAGQITVGAVGYQAALKDDPSFRMIYRDADMTRWAGPGDERRIEIIDNDQTPGDPTIVGAKNTGEPKLCLIATTPWQSTAGPSVEAWYDATPGLLIAAFYYRWTEKRVSGMSAKISFGVDGKTPVDKETLGGSGTGTKVADAAYRYAVLRWSQTGADTADGVSREIHFKDLAAYGNTPLYPALLQGVEPDAGYFAHDMIADVLRQAAPDIGYSVGPDGSIKPGGFVVPHASFPDPTYVWDAIEQLNAYDFYDFGVWEDRTFHWRPIDPDRLTWDARYSDGARPALEGPQADDLYNGVVVVYQNTVGETKTIGPTASRNQDATDSLLSDPDPANVLNAHGMRRWGIINIPTPTVQKAAARIGQLWLLEHSRPQRRGTLTVPGDVRRPGGGLEANYMVRAGDHIRVPDLAVGSDVRHRIVESTYDDTTRMLTCQLDSTPHLIDAILGRIGVDFVGLISQG